MNLGTTTVERPSTTSVDQATSMPGLLLHQARVRPDALALTEKRLGRWIRYTWADYWRHVSVAGMAMRALGVDVGDRIAIHSENRPEWVFADLGAQGLGAIPFGIYPTNPAAEVEYLLAHSGAKLLVVEDQEQLDKAIAVKDRCPELQHIVVIDTKGLRDYDVPEMMSWADFMDLGEQALAAAPDAFEESVRARTRDEVATIVYTSGTTGPPKAAMLTSGNMLHIGATATRVLECSERDEILSYLPLCHAAEKDYTLWVPLQVGCPVNFAESIDSVQQNLAEVQPTLFLGVPRIWQKMQSSIELRMLDSTWFKRLNYRLWIGVARWVGERMVENRGRHTPVTRAVHALGHLFLYRSLLVKLGLLRCRRAMSGSAPISRETLAFFLGIGIPISEAYGLTECVTISWTRKDDVRLGTVGPPVDTMEVRLAEDGEIQVRGPMVFAGYFRDPEATAATFTEDGWLMTGDVGEWADGHLKITDRKKDIIITAGGKNVAPTEIENALRASPYIKEAIVIGEARKYLTALIGIEPDIAADWAQRKGIAFTTYRDLTEKPEVIDLIAQEVKRVNTSFNQVEQIKKFRLLPKELDEDDQEVTATQKVKRSVVAKRFADLVEDMYRSAS